MTMAGEIASAFVILRPKADPNFGSEMQREVQSNVQKAESFGKSATLGVTLPIIGAGVAAGKAAISFESAFAGVIKTVDGTEQQLGDLRQGIIDMGNSIPASREEIAGVAEAAGQLGVNIDGIESFTRTMIDLGNATNLTAEEAATNIARIQNVMNIPTDDVDNFGAALVALGNNSATTEAEILMMSNRLTGMGAQFGMSSGELLGFGAALSSVGVQAEGGGTAMTLTANTLDELRRDIIKSGASMEEFAGSTEMAALYTNIFGDDLSKLESMTGTEMLEGLVSGLQKSTEEGWNVNDAMEALSITGIRQQDALRKLVSGGDLLTESLKMGNEAFEENSALTKEVANRYGTMESQLQVAKNRATDFLRVMGEAFIPMLADGLAAAQPFFDVLQEFAAGFAALPEPMRKLIGGFFLFAAAIGPVVLAGAKIVKMFQMVKGALLGLKVAMAANPFMLIVAAIALVAFLIYKYWDEIVAALKVAWDWIKDTAGEVADFFVEVWEDALGWLEDVWDDISGVFTTVLDTIVGAVTDAWDFVSGLTTDVFNAIKDFIEDWWRVIILVFTGPIGVIINLVINFWDEIKAVTEAVLDFIMDVIETAWNVIKTVTETVWNVIRTVIEAVWLVIRTVIETQVAVARAVIETGFNLIRSVIETAMNTVKAVIQGAWDAIVGTFNWAKDQITSAINLILVPIGGIEGALNLLQNGASRVWGGIVGTFEWARDTLIRVLGEIKSAARDALGPLGDVVGAVGKVGGGVASGFNWLTGRAVGGAVVPGRDYLVGEEGPEILRMGASGGMVYNARQTARMLGAGSSGPEQVNVTLTGPIYLMSDQDITDTARKLGREARRELRGQGERGDL